MYVHPHIYEPKHSLSEITQSTDIYKFDDVQGIEKLDSIILREIMERLEVRDQCNFVSTTKVLRENMRALMGDPRLGVTWREHASFVTTLRNEACMPVALHDDDYFLFVTPTGKIVDCHIMTLEDGRMSYKHVWRGNNVGITGVSIGTDFVVAVSRKGSVFTWGTCDTLGDVGQLGYDQRQDSLVMKVQALIGYKIMSVSAGMDHCIAVDANGAVYSWGNNFNGQCGFDPLGNEEKIRPQRVSFGLGIRVSALSVSAGPGYSLVVTDKGALYAFGEFPGSVNAMPHRVIFEPHHVIVSVAAGAEHALALTQAGEVFAWGNNQNGQLGTGDSDPRVEPTRVFADPDSITSLFTLRAVAASEYTSGAVAQDGRLFVWGRFSYSYVISPREISDLIESDGTREHFTAISINHKMLTGVTRENTLVALNFTTNQLNVCPCNEFI